MTRRTSAVVTLAGVAVLGVLAAGCGSGPDRAERDSLSALATPAATLPAKTPTSGAEPKCGDPTRSLRPVGTLPAPGRMPAGSFMRTIQERGRLVAGVDQNTLLFGYFDPLTGRLQGLEIDLLRDIAKAILGDPNAIEFKVLTTADQRTQDVQDGTRMRCWAP